MSKKIFILAGITLAISVLILIQAFFVNITNQSENPNGNVSLNLENKNTTVIVENDLHAVVVKICESVEKGDVISLENLVAEVPEDYTQKSRDLMRKALKMDEKTFKEVTRKKENTFTINPYPISANKKELVYNAIPEINSIQEHKEKFKGIVKLKQNVSEAKVIVTFGSPKLPKINYEILLIRVDDKWKMFSFTYPDKWAETYAEDMEV